MALDDLRHICHAVQVLVEGVKPDQWNAATPCTEWDVRQLINHMATGNAIFTARAAGERSGPPTPEERAVDHLGADPPASFAAVTRRMLTAFGEPGFSERRIATPIGDQPGSMVIEMRATELLVHGWDLARATGQQPGLPEHLAERVLSSVRPRLSGRPRDGVVPFGTEQPASEDAPAIDRLAAFLGRPL